MALAVSVNMILITSMGRTSSAGVLQACPHRNFTKELTIGIVKLRTRITGVLTISRWKLVIIRRWSGRTLPAWDVATVEAAWFAVMTHQETMLASSLQMLTRQRRPVMSVLESCSL